MLFDNIHKTVATLETKTISNERKAVLQHLVDYIQDKVNTGVPVQLNFICTHNSRRSQMGQVWAIVMAQYYDFSIAAFSGGTEITACHPNTIKTLEKSGFLIQSKSMADNKHYECTFSNQHKSIILYSKLYNDEINPKSNFAAIMTCGHAEENCPLVMGCEKRIAITYEDPKAYDNTTKQEEKYLERSLQIATEMKYVFEQIQKR